MAQLSQQDIDNIVKELPYKAINDPMKYYYQRAFAETINEAFKQHGKRFMAVLRSSTVPHVDSTGTRCLCTFSISYHSADSLDELKQYPEQQYLFFEKPL